MDNQKDNFDSLNLNENLIKGVYLYGFTQPSPIQIEGINSINTGRDCILQSQSGTGKTATYLLGVMNRLDAEIKECQGIIITPTRELAAQVYNVADELAKYTNFEIAKCIGGTDITQNKTELKTSSVVIGTIGRIHHMIKEKKINIHKLKFLVLDEADEILSDGMNEKIQYIFDKAPNGIQVVLISATMSINVFNVSKKYMHEPIKVLLKNDEVVVDLISQFYLNVEKEDYKFETLLDLYNLVSASKACIFCNTIEKIKFLETKLKENNFPISVIHSSMDQDQRNSVVQDFRDNKTRLLLTTDLLSRGIDIPEVNMVINYDLPPKKETYIHRIGRCGRFDKKGVAITMVKMDDPCDEKNFIQLQKYYKTNIPEMPDSIDKYL
jgi:translation initiation factor 4A